MPPTKRHPGRPRDQSLQVRRREEILDQAARAFAADGYPNTDVQWIADALQISKGTVYRYFPSKEELFDAAMRRGIEQLHATLHHAGDQIADPIERILVCIEAYLRFFKEHPELVELFIQERAEFKSRRKPAYFEHRDAARGPWRATIADLITSGRLRAMPVERVIDVLGDVLYGTMFTNYFAGRDKHYREQAQDILDVVFRGILSDKERARRADDVSG